MSSGICVQCRSREQQWRKKDHFYYEDVMEFFIYFLEIYVPHFTLFHIRVNNILSMFYIFLHSYYAFFDFENIIFIVLMYFKMSLGKKCKVVRTFVWFNFYPTFEKRVKLQFISLRFTAYRFVSYNVQIRC